MFSKIMQVDSNSHSQSCKAMCQWYHARRLLSLPANILKADITQSQQIRQALNQRLKYCKLY